VYRLKNYVINKVTINIYCCDNYTFIYLYYNNHIFTALSR